MKFSSCKQKVKSLVQEGAFEYYEGMLFEGGARMGLCKSEHM